MKLCMIGTGYVGLVSGTCFSDLGNTVYCVDKDENKMLIRAAVLGLVIYGTYGFTLSAILPKYDLVFALKETIWGIFLYTVATKLTNLIFKQINV